MVCRIRRATASCTSDRSPCHLHPVLCCSAALYHRRRALATRSELLATADMATDTFPVASLPRRPPPPQIPVRRAPPHGEQRRCKQQRKELQSVDGGGAGIQFSGGHHAARAARACGSAVRVNAVRRTGRQREEGVSTGVLPSVPPRLLCRGSSTAVAVQCSSVQKNRCVRPLEV